MGFLEQTEFNLCLLGIEESTGHSVCVKQYSKQGNTQAVDLARKEIQAYQMIEKEMEKKSEGSQYIQRIYSYFEDCNSIFICQDLKRKTLADRMFTIKPSQQRGQSVYNVKH